MILYINACARKDSRTKELADYYLSKTNEKIHQIDLYNERFPLADENYLNVREEEAKKGNNSHPYVKYAHDFARADHIVIAAPYWDLSFPAILKQYLEMVNVVNVTFRYSPEGIPQGLCKAKDLTYIVTAGGDYAPQEYGYGYVTALAHGYWGIEKTQLFSALGLDINGADAEAIMREAKQKIDEATGESAVN